MRNSLKWCAGFVALVLSRTIPHPPNVEAVLATTLPFAKKFGALQAAVFALLANASFDFISGRLGLWTVYTSLTYAGIGYFAAAFFKSREFNRRNLVSYSVASTLVFDLVTALLFGFQFGQPLAVTVIGQIPFTLYHLLGNVVLCAFVSPLLYKHLADNPALELDVARFGWRSQRI